MNSKILEQKRLMQKAIDIINHIEQVERIYQSVDPNHVREEKEKYSTEYAIIVQSLMQNFINNSGMVLKEIPENKLAAIA